MISTGSRSPHENIDDVYPRGVENSTLEQYSIAQRMSWAAYRKTTRREDRSYCLLGLFGVVMPLHYGEGAVHAFKRLQEEIIKESAAQSILAWQTEWIWNLSSDGSIPKASFLATDAICFRSRGHVGPAKDRSHSAYSINNVGLEIEACLVRFKGTEDGKNFSMNDIRQMRSALGFGHRSLTMVDGRGSQIGAVINCSSGRDPSMVYVLPLEQESDGCFSLIPPIHCLELEWEDLKKRTISISSTTAWHKITILRTPGHGAKRHSKIFDGLHAKLELYPGDNPSFRLTPRTFWPLESWNESTLCFGPSKYGSSHKVAGITIACQEESTE